MSNFINQFFYNKICLSTFSYSALRIIYSATFLNKNFREFDHQFLAFKKITFTILFNNSIKTQQKMTLQKKQRPINLEDTQFYDKITKLEHKILNKIQYVKNNKKHIDCVHASLQHSFATPPNELKYDPKSNYFDLFWKRYLTNQVWHYRIKETQQNVSELEDSINNIETNIEKYLDLKLNRKQRIESSEKEPEISNHLYKNQRRNPRKAKLQYACKISNCQKIYDSKVALELHSRIKHSSQSYVQFTNKKPIKKTKASTKQKQKVINMEIKQEEDSQNLKPVALKKQQQSDEESQYQISQQKEKRITRLNSKTRNNLNLSTNIIKKSKTEQIKKKDQTYQEQISQKKPKFKWIEDSSNSML